MQDPMLSIKSDKIAIIIPMSKIVTAAVLAIGDELLSGRTRDANITYIANALTHKGINLCEARIIADTSDAIIAAVNELRLKYDYLFTTGGIGPTHDDITADSIAAAFGVNISPHPEATRRLAAHYAAAHLEFNPPRQRMARIPHGASLIDNPVSVAPGFILDNVYVMAGIPRICQAMLDGVLARLKGGMRIHSITLTANMPEAQMADFAARQQRTHQGVNIGLYPFYAPEGLGVSLVIRGGNKDVLEQIAAAARQFILNNGAKIITRPIANTEAQTP